MLGFLDDIFCQLEGKPTRSEEREKRQANKATTAEKKRQGLGSLLYSLFVSDEYRNKGLSGWKDDKEKFKIDLVNDIKNFLFTKWEKPWVPGLIFDTKNMVVSGFRNVTGRIYHNSSNILSLKQNKGESPFFITLARLLKEGGKILDKTKVTSIISFIPIVKDEAPVNGTEEGKKPDYMLPRFHPVINVDFVEGIKKPIYKTVDFKNLELNEYVEAFIAEIKKRKRIPTLIYDQADRCYYTHNLDFRTDEIHLVQTKQFKGIGEYYSTLFHEITHSTMNPSRLGRGKSKTLRQVSYANEELVAEMGAMIICSELGLEYVRQNSLSYLSGWLKEAKGTADDAMLEAYAFACDAAEYLLEGIDLTKLVPETITTRAEEVENEPVTAKPDGKKRIPNSGGKPKTDRGITLTTTATIPEKEPKPADGRNTAMVETDPATRQKIKNTLQEEELILRTGKSNGKKLSSEEIEAVKKRVITAKKRLGIVKPNQPEPKFRVGQKVLSNSGKTGVIRSAKYIVTDELTDQPEGWRVVEREVMGKLAALIQIQKGEGRGMSKPLFVSNLKGFLERLHKNGHFANVTKALALVRDVQAKYNFVVFAPKNSIWLLENTAPIEVVKATGAESIYKAEGCAVENNRTDERVRLFMDEKPSSEAITYLKRHGFKWSPFNKAWQRQNTQNGLNEALRFAKQFFPKEERPTEPAKAHSEKVEIIDFPVKSIYTDEKRFQNRKNAFSEDSKQRIIQALENGTFDWSKFDPITLWKDPQDSKTYVLSGHSRFAAFKEKNREGVVYDGSGFASIPSKIFKGTEAQAIDLALNSNTLSTKETDVERAVYYNKSRETCELKNLSWLGAKSDCEKKVENACREAEGKNANFILNLSYLNPGGYLIDTLARLGAEKDNDSTNVLRTVANWIGEARRSNPLITDEQEREIAQFLLNGGYGNKGGQFRNKIQFSERLDYSFSKWKARGAKPGDNLNLANTLSKSQFEKDFDGRVAKAKQDYDEAIAEHEEKHKKYLLAVMDKQLTHEKMSDLMKPIVAWVERSRMQYERVKGQKGDVKKAAEAQTSLFGMEKIGEVIAGKLHAMSGELGKFIGGYEKQNYSIVIRGDKGAGKSRFMYQLLDLFASNKLKCGFLSLEMASNSSVSTGYRDMYISAKNKDLIHISNQALDYDSLNSLCKIYDVLAVDSWTKLRGLKQEDFDRLQKENPQTIILAIFQSTTGKVTRGGNMPEFDAAIVIHVHEGGIAECEKNRYQATDLTYNVFDKKLISQEVESV